MGACCGKSKKGVAADDIKGGPVYSTQPASNEDEELKAVFNEFDTNGDGTIDENELKAIMQKLGKNPSNDQVEAMFRAADKDGNGKIGFNEFLEISKSKPLAQSLKDVFDELDVDKDGHLTKEEIQVAFVKMGNPLSKGDIDAVFAQVDLNKDGNVNLEEFIKIMSGSVKKPNASATAGPNEPTPISA